MNLFRDKHKSTAPVIIFDIRSGSIGAALITFKTGGVPTVLHSIRTPISFQKEIRPDLFLKRMLGTLEGVALELEQKGIAKLDRGLFGPKKIGQILCVFSSPWYTSQNKILTIERKKSFTVSTDFIGKMLSKAKKHFEKSVEENEATKHIRNPQVIESNVIYTTLNGYKTSNPYGRKANSVEIAVFFSLISCDVSKMVTEVFEKVFNTREISFHSFALTSFSVIRDIFHAEENFLIMDISGEITDISLIREGVLLETVSFPIGKFSMLRRIAYALKTIPEEAHSLVRLHFESKRKGTPAVEKELEAAEKEWQSMLGQALTDLSEGILLPKTVFLTVDSDLGEWFRCIISGYALGQESFTAGPFSVVTLNGTKFHKYYDVRKGVESDSFLGLETLFFHKVLVK